MPKKGSKREDMTLQLLSKFKQKLHTVKSDEAEEEQPKRASASAPDDEMDEDEEADLAGDGWMRKSLKFESNDPVLAKGPYQYDIHKIILGLIYFGKCNYSNVMIFGVCPASVWMSCMLATPGRQQEGRRLVRHLRPAEPAQQAAQGGGQQAGRQGLEAVAVLWGQKVMDH